MRRRAHASLTMENFEGILERVLLLGDRRLDLSSLTFMDPYALLLLRLLVEHQRELADPLTVVWPSQGSLPRWKEAMRFEHPQAGGGTSPDPERALQPITRIVEEAEVSHLVDQFDARLGLRYPNLGQARKTLIKVMIELLQNIPQHGNATGKVDDPFGIAAMQDYEHSIFLAVADKGVGLRGSLSLRDGFSDLSDEGALQEILRHGMSRFEEATRGGELKNIVNIAHRLDGAIVIRSGRAMIFLDYMTAWMSETYEVPDFPGVQIGLRLPRTIFEGEDVG